MTIIKTKSVTSLDDHYVNAMRKTARNLASARGMLRTSNDDKATVKRGISTVLRPTKTIQRFE